MAERTPYSLAVDNFKSHQDDFETWIELFESAIDLAYPAVDAATLNGHCIKWLPLKLDSEARTIYKNVTEAEWKKKKEKLSELLVNPEERYTWLTRRTTITWDGKESLHTLAAKIIQAVNKYDPKNGDKDREYFFRFRAAMPLEYKKAIDMNCGNDRPKRCTIAQAKTIACRLQAANAKATVSPGLAPTEKTVAFAGAAMSEERLKAVELGLQEMRVERSGNEARRTEDNRQYGRPNSRDRYDSRNDSRVSDRRPDSRDRYEDRGRNDRFRNSRDSLDRQNDRYGNRYRGYSNERQSYDNRDRSRRDNYERPYRQEFRGNSRDRGDQGRPTSSDRQSQFNQRDQQNYNTRPPSRERWNSRGRWNSRDRGNSRERWNSRGRQPSRDRGNDRNSNGWTNQRPRDGSYNRGNDDRRYSNSQSNNDCWNPDSRGSSRDRQQRETSSTFDTASMTPEFLAAFSELMTKFQPGNDGPALQ